MPPRRRSTPRGPEYAALGEAIESLLEEKSLTQEGVADESGLDLTQIGDLVRGQSNPTYRNLLRLCKGLHVTPGELMTRYDETWERRSAEAEADATRTSGRGGAGG